MFSVDTDITVTGVGLVLSPGSDVTVTLELGGNQTTKHVRNTGEDDVVPVYFDTPLRLACETYAYRMREAHVKVKASIKGKGVARVHEDEEDADDGNSIHQPPEVSYHRYFGRSVKNYEEVKVDGKNKQGSRVGEVKFEFLDKSSNVFSKLYFYVNTEARPSEPRVLAQAPAGPSRQQEDSDNDDTYHPLPPSAFLPYLGL